MATFKVYGPFAIPVIAGKGGRSIDDDLLAFWEDSGCEYKVGCYIFGIRQGGGTKPYYAGRTTKTFGSECFQAHKRVKYHKALMSVTRGTPVMFFLAPVVARGRVNAKSIKELEQRLIGLSLKRNLEMTNIQGKSSDNLVITGVMGSRGRPDDSASALRKTLGL